MDHFKCVHGNFGECELCGDIKPLSSDLDEIADIETACEPITNALYATGRFTTEQCDQLADGILQYIKDYGLIIYKKR
jgi:hypothetical protein